MGNTPDHTAPIPKRSVVLIRHGMCSSANGALIGHSDVSLNAQGYKQARALASMPWLSQQSLCYSSPLIRARRTAEVALSGRQHTLQFDDRLAEIHFGRWEGLTFSQIAEQDPLLSEHWLKRPLEFVFPQGEAVTNFVERVASFADDLIQCLSGTSVIFSHAGVIRVLLCILLGIDVKHQHGFMIEHAAPCVVEIFDRTGVLRTLNGPP